MMYTKNLFVIYEKGIYKRNLCAIMIKLNKSKLNKREKKYTC